MEEPLLRTNMPPERVLRRTSSLLAEAQTRLWATFRRHRKDGVLIVLGCAAFLAIYSSVPTFRQSVEDFFGRFDSPAHNALIGAVRGVFAIGLPIFTGSMRRTLSRDSSLPQGIVLHTAFPLLQAHPIAWRVCFNFVYYGFWGMVFFYYMHMMTWLFGETPPFGAAGAAGAMLTIVIPKVLFDLFVMAPLWMVPLHQLGPRWRDHFGNFHPTCTLGPPGPGLFSKSGLLQEWWFPGWCVDLFTAGPAVVVLFLMPDEIQAPLINFYGTFLIILQASLSEEGFAGFASASGSSPGSPISRECLLADDILESRGLARPSDQCEEHSFRLSGV